MANKAWPTKDDLIAWVPDGASLSLSPEQLEDLVADATAAILERLDTGKLPDGWDDEPEEPPEEPPTTCPRTVWRAILLEAAHLVTRRDSVNGLIAFGEYAMRVGVDADIEKLLEYWQLDAEP